MHIYGDSGLNAFEGLDQKWLRWENSCLFCLFFLSLSLFYFLFLHFYFLICEYYIFIHLFSAPSLYLATFVWSFKHSIIVWWQMSEMLNAIRHLNPEWIGADNRLHGSNFANPPRTWKAHRMTLISFICPHTHDLIWIHFLPVTNDFCEYLLQDCVITY